MYLRPHTTLKIGFKELVFDFKKSVLVFFLTMLLLWVFHPKSYLDVFARVLSWNGVLIFAPNPSLLKDEGANTRNEKWREKNRQIVASPKVSLYDGRMKTGEGWPSGLRRAPGKRVGANVPQGFKSPPFCQFVR